jgi:hypothetical protein
MALIPDRREELTKLTAETIDTEQLHGLALYERVTAIQEHARQILYLTPDHPIEALLPEAQEELFVMRSMRNGLLERDEAALRWQS